MKIVIFTLLLLCSVGCRAQLYGTVSGGVSNEIKPFLSPGIGVNIHGGIIEGSMKIIINNNEPVLPLLHLGWRYSFIEAGYSGGAVVYKLGKSTDTRDNILTNGLYIRLHINPDVYDDDGVKAFVEYSHNEMDFFSIGIKQNL